MPDPIQPDSLESYIKGKRAQEVEGSIADSSKGFKAALNEAAPVPPAPPPPVAPPIPPIVVRTPVPITGTPHQAPPDPESTRRKLETWQRIHGPHSLWGHMMRYVVQDDGQSQPAVSAPKPSKNVEEKPVPEAKKEAPKDDKKEEKKEGEGKKKAA